MCLQKARTQISKIDIKYTDVTKERTEIVRKNLATESERNEVIKVLKKLAFNQAERINKCLQLIEDNINEVEKLLETETEEDKNIEK